MKDVTSKNSGFAAFFETGGDGGHRYLGCRVARGPKPPGATEDQLDRLRRRRLSLGRRADRADVRTLRLGGGACLDDCIAIHGSFQKVIRAEGNRLILERGNRGKFRRE